jgi:hypothetical protein
MTTAEPLAAPWETGPAGPEPAGDDDEAVLAPAVARLRARYGHAVPDETIRLVLRTSHDRLRAQARVTTYLLVLAERAASTQLAALARIEAPSSLSSGP